MTLESTSRSEGSDAGAALAFARLHPSIALAPYVEGLVVGRRVAVLGDATLGLADALVARGARLVHAYDPDAARVAEAIARQAPAFGSPAAGRPAARGVVYAVLGDDLGVRDGAFDTVVIPDLSLFADRTEVVRRAKKLCSHTGAVVVSSPNPDARRRLIARETNGSAAPSYYEIFDLLTLQFAVVRMVGQAPFVGYAIVDFAPDREPDVSFDASLMAGTEEPESFVAIASDRPVATDAYLVVEVPASDVLVHFDAQEAAIAQSGPPSTRHRPGDQASLAESQARTMLMQVELDDLRGQNSELSRQLEAAHKVAEVAGARAREAAEEAGTRDRENARTAGSQAERWRELEARAGDEHVRAERLGHKVRDLEEELVRQRDRAQKLTKQLDDEKRVRQKAEIELGMARGLQRTDADDETGVRVEELTAALKVANGRADGLASELLAKSKETAELRRENEAAEAKLAELGRALQTAHAKLDEVEGEALTMRRPQAAYREPVVVTTEVQTGMVARITRLESSANEERRQAEEAKLAAQESKLVADELRREADESKRVAGELRREADESKRGASEAKRTADELKRAAEDAKRVADEWKRAADDARRGADEAKRLASESKRVADESKLEAAAAAALREVAARRADSLQVALDQERAGRKDLVLAKATLESEVIGLRQRLEQSLSASEAEASPEVGQLEAALRERGQVIAQLERDLRESDRIGRELIAELEIVRPLGGGDDDGGAGGATNGHGGARKGGAAYGGAGLRAAPETAARAAAPGHLDVVTTDAFQHRIDALAADAAQKQAEVLTSAWKIQVLERELSTARAASADPSVTQRELSTALVRAQSEIAELRRALTLGGRDAAGAPRAVVEDAVLLHQQVASRAP